MLELRCSGLSRVMSCPGYTSFKDLPEQEEGDAAKEGTAAAEYLEGLLTGKPLGTHASNGVFFDEDIKFYVGTVAYDIWEASKGQVRAEQKVEFRGIGWKVEGRYDASYIVDNTLHIDDLKYGWKLINPFENWQLLGYAIGEFTKIMSEGRHGTIDRVKMTIRQPRPHHEDGDVRSWTISVEELERYYLRLDAHLSATAQGDRTLNTGPHCYYCPAVTSCPAANKALWNSVDVIVSDWQQDNMTAQELSRQLSLIKRVKEIPKVREQSITDLATYRLRKGDIIPGYAYEQSLGHRAWVNGVTVESIAGLTGKDITEKSLMSPAKAEKLGISDGILQALTIRPVVGHKVVPIDADKLANKYFGGK